jgi:hypothetical protein
MNTASLDKRLRQLERKVPDSPCPIPEHNRAFIFIENVSEEQDAAQSSAHRVHRCVSTVQG